jgi:hypothetical protein
MARCNNNPLLKGIRGKIADGILVRQYKHGTFISAMPNMTRVKKTDLQIYYRSKFAQAIAYAKSIIKDKKKKAEYAKKIPKGKTVYHAAIKEYLKKNA